MGTVDDVDLLLHRVDRHWRRIGMPAPARAARATALRADVTARPAGAAVPGPAGLDAVALAEAWAGRDRRARVAGALLEGILVLLAGAGLVTALAGLGWWFSSADVASLAVLAGVVLVRVLVQLHLVLGAPGHAAARWGVLALGVVLAVVLVAATETLAPDVPLRAPWWVPVLLLAAAAGCAVGQHRLTATWR